MRRLPILLAFTLLVGCGEPAPVQVPEAAELKKLSPGTHQETGDVPGVGSVKYTIEIPNGYDGKTPVPLVLALHYGYDGAKPAAYTGKGMIDAFRPGLSGLNAIIIAPDALGGSWTDAKNEKAAVWLTKSAMKTYAIDPKKVVITGFSLGGEGTWFIGSAPGPVHRSHPRGGAGRRRQGVEDPRLRDPLRQGRDRLAQPG